MTELTPEEIMMKEKQRNSIREKILSVFKKKEEKKAEKDNEQRFDTIIVLQETEIYIKLQYEKKIKYLCKKCPNKLDNPLRSFKKETHVVQHFKQRHEIK